MRRWLYPVLLLVFLFRFLPGFGQNFLLEQAEFFHFSPKCGAPNAQSARSFFPVSAALPQHVAQGACFQSIKAGGRGVLLSDNWGNVVWACLFVWVATAQGISHDVFRKHTMRGNDHGPLQNIGKLPYIARPGDSFQKRHPTWIYRWHAVVEN